MLSRLARSVAPASRAFATAADASPYAGMKARRRPINAGAAQVVQLTKVPKGSSDATSLFPAPVRVSGVEGKYAHAAYAAAMRNTKRPVGAVEKQLNTFAAAVAGNENLRSALENPTVAVSAKKQVIGDMLAKAKVHPVTNELVMSIVENGRMAMLPKIASSYSTIMKAHRNEVAAVVTTAKALKPKMADKVKGTLQKHVGSKHQLSVDFKVDPTIVGGVTVQIGDKNLDLSVATRIQQLRRVLEQPL